MKRLLLVPFFVSLLLSEPASAACQWAEFVTAGSPLRFDAGSGALLNPRGDWQCDLRSRGLGKAEPTMVRLGNCRSKRDSQAGTEPRKWLALEHSNDIGGGEPGRFHLPVSSVEHVNGNEYRFAGTHSRFSGTAGQHFKCTLTPR